MAKNETDPDVLAAFDRMIEGVKGVERKGATMPYCSINGNMYAMISKANIIGLRLSDSDLQAVKAAGYDEAQVIVSVLHVALNTLTHYINEVAKTEIDFPVVTHRAR